MSEQFSTPTIQLNVKIGSDQGKVYTLKKKEISIGRGLENDIVIAHTEVSRCHTRISYQYGIFILEDLPSGKSHLMIGMPKHCWHLLSRTSHKI